MTKLVKVGNRLAVPPSGQQEVSPGGQRFPGTTDPTIDILPRIIATPLGSNCFAIDAFFEHNPNLPGNAIVCWRSIVYSMSIVDGNQEEGPFFTGVHFTFMPFLSHIDTNFFQFFAENVLNNCFLPGGFRIAKGTIRAAPAGFGPGGWRIAIVELSAPAIVRFNTDPDPIAGCLQTDFDLCTPPIPPNPADIPDFRPPVFSTHGLPVVNCEEGAGPGPSGAAPPPSSGGLRGMGDAFAIAVQKLTLGKLAPCAGCDERQRKLNKLLPFHRHSSHDES